MEDDIDALDNKALRLKCIQYGLPNVPVTDSSRKILIRRLRASISNNNASPSSKPSKIGISLKNDSITSEDHGGPVKQLKNRCEIAAPPLVKKKINRRSDFLLTSESPPKSGKKLNLSASRITTTSYNQETAAVKPDFYEHNQCSKDGEYGNLKRVVDNSAYNQPSFNASEPPQIRKFTSPHENLFPNLRSAYTDINTNSISTNRSTNLLSSTTKNFEKSLSNEFHGKTYQPEFRHRYNSKDGEYLSSFARSLERASITAGTNYFDKSAAGLSRKAVYSSENEATIKATFVNFLLALEKQYQLKKCLIIFLMLILVVFVYVFFLT